MQKEVYILISINKLTSLNFYILDQKNCINKPITQFIKKEA